MFKKIKTSFHVILGFQDPAVDRLQTQVENLNNSVQTLQTELFLIERPLADRSSPVIDRIVYQDDSITGVTSNPNHPDFPNPRPLGVGRRIVNNNVVISTLIHESETIKSGEYYKFQDDGTFTITNNRQEAELVALSDGIGWIVREKISLPSEA